MNEDLKNKIEDERKNTRRLTVEQEKFCQNYCQLLPIWKAYKLAYGSADQTAKRKSYELIKKPHIQSRIAEIQREIGSHFSVTLDEIVANFRMVRKLALEEGNYQAANTANQALAKLIGHDLSNDRVVEPTYEHPLLKTLGNPDKAARLLGTSVHKAPKDNEN